MSECLYQLDIRDGVIHLLPKGRPHTETREESNKTQHTKN